MAFQVESKGWVTPDDPDEWLPCLSKPKATRAEAERFIESMQSDSWEGARQYPYRIVEVEDSANHERVSVSTYSEDEA